MPFITSPSHFLFFPAMLRRLLLPLFALALLATEATAQTRPATKKVVRKTTVTKRRPVTTKRKVVTTKKVAAQVDAPAVAAPSTTWSGWSNEPVALPVTPNNRPTVFNVSVAPGMPVNQLGHGVTTDYNGRPLRPAAKASTSITMAATR